MKSACQCRGKSLLPCCAGLLSGLLLLLMPKCPACVAAYVALGTGIGLSFTTAAALRTGAILFCLAVLVLSICFFIQRRLDH
ncbi:hypothetical protein WJU23_00195 [Prosthecobacter sp. SYSU 5D2]|uniref:hypothetical protein n=1 Tax=Prosthecobacter sp. SYSU 5D2 TaxID=3134134 RepID=UPI0031FE9B29